MPSWGVASLACVQALGAHRACALRVRCFLMCDLLRRTGISNTVAATNGDLAGVVIARLAVPTLMATSCVHAHLVKSHTRRVAFRTLVDVLTRCRLSNSSPLRPCALVLARANCVITILACHVANVVQLAAAAP